MTKGIPFAEQKGYNVYVRYVTQKDGAPGETRTPDLDLTGDLLYPAELPTH